ncbi:MAG: hypothetical protein CML43_08740 [Rhodobacteraceae bacterium]|nr:hypothetical protein [Paracoccaceae bacterium]
MPCLALPCLALPCLALPCLALPCLALPCLEDPPPGRNAKSKQACPPPRSEGARQRAGAGCPHEAHRSGFSAPPVPCPSRSPPGRHRPKARIPISRSPCGPWRAPPGSPGLPPKRRRPARRGRAAQGLRDRAAPPKPGTGRAAQAAASNSPASARSISSAVSVTP